MSTDLNNMKLDIAKELLTSRGFKYKKDDLEWDIENQDSQLYMIYEDVDFVVNYLLKDLSNFEYEQEEEEEEQEQKQEKIPRDKTVTRSNCTFIFMDSGYGNPAYVKDVREWLRLVDEQGIPNDTEVDGRLHLDYDW